MAATTFPRFSSLPLELRRKIYLFATPSRIVHVQEEAEDQEEFEETLRTTPVQLKLDPSLVHFAFLWRQRAPFASAQQTLDDCGFTVTSKKLPSIPWEPSAATPPIPLHWISNHPREAWELLRKGCLYSKAPIPALLHTCAESRSELISLGYQLAFETRSSRAGTWFNFERDVLYIGIDTWEDRKLLNSGPWDLSQFHPNDLKRVRKLALKGVSHILSIRDRFSPTASDFNLISDVLRIFPGVKELFLVEWGDYDMDRWSDFSDGIFLRQYEKKENKNQTAEDTPTELWNCVAVEEIDALLSLLAPRDKYRTPMNCAGEMAKLLKVHKQENGSTSSYFQDQQLQLQQWLLEQRETIVNDSHIPVSPWAIPKIEIAHVLPQSMTSFLFQERQRAWVDFSETRRKQQEVPTPVTVTPAPAPLSPTIQALEDQLPFTQDDEDAFNEAHHPTYCCGQCEHGYYQDHFMKDQQKWWIEEGMVPAPKNEIIY